MKVSKLFVKKLALVASFGMVSMLLGGEQAEAATDTTSFSVDVQVDSFCDISATPVAFDNYDPGAGADLDTAGGVGAGGTSGIISVNCTQNVVFGFEFDDGMNTSTLPGTARAMDDGAGTLLGYRLELSGSDADLAPGATVATDTGDGYDPGGLVGLQTWTIDGVIPQAQSVAGGNYQDTVTATLNY